MKTEHRAMVGGGQPPPEKQQFPANDSHSPSPYKKSPEQLAKFGPYAQLGNGIGHGISYGIDQDGSFKLT